MTQADVTTVTMVTPAGRGAVAVVAVEGAAAAEFVQRFFHPKAGAPLAERAVGQIIYGRWGGEQAEDVIACRRSESFVEVHCHGGSAAVRRIIDDLFAAGAQEQAWSKYVLRHEASPIRAAARIALAHATTARTAEILLDQYHGALETALHQIAANLEERAENLSAPQAETHKLLARAAWGLHLTQPWRVVVAGPPNVGKSSLVNALVGYQRTIVHDQPGTTRDVVTALTALEGWPIELCDTAGWRESDDELETAGVARAQQQAAAADCVLLVFNVAQPWTEVEQRLVETWRGAMVVLNKCDLLADGKLHGGPANSVLVSAVTRAGLDRLSQQIVERLMPTAAEASAAAPFTAEQVEQLRTVAAALATGDAEGAKVCVLALLSGM